MNNYTLCSECPHYHRGQGDPKCLRCKIYEQWDWDNQLTNTIATISLPEGMLENIWQNQQTQIVIEAMQRLPAQYAAVLSMRFFGNLTNAEIGEILGLHRMTVSKRIAKGLRIIRAEVKK